VAEFARDLISMRTREGMAVARAKRRLKGKQPKLSKAQRTLLFELHDSGDRSACREWRAMCESGSRGCDEARPIALGLAAPDRDFAPFV